MFIIFKNINRNGIDLLFWFLVYFRDRLFVVVLYDILIVLRLFLDFFWYGILIFKYWFFKLYWSEFFDVCFTFVD